MVDVRSLVETFQQLYSSPPRVFSAPGRVNLIGEHTDYNDGFVLPMAINRRTYVAAAARNDRNVRVRSLNLQEQATFSLDEDHQFEEARWANYVAGVGFVLQEQGLRLPGLDLAIDSDVPIGAGLSSSAAIEVSVGLAWSTFAEHEIDARMLALAAQKAEHVYAGTQCGIMDQVTATLAQEGHALLIDCLSLEATMVPLKLGGAEVVVCNTNVKHELASSAYNQRRAQCEQGVAILQQKLPDVRALRDVSIADFEEFEGELPSPIDRRCRHVITENDRTLSAAEALRLGDLGTVGELMALSHRSLRDDYEVSSRELDMMVEIAERDPACIGARMTGGGFGGCTVNLVRHEALDDFRRTIEQTYFGATGIKPDIYVVQADGGMNEIEL